MSELAVSGQDLKRMIKLTRKGPLPFAFNPAKTPDESLFALHRKKNQSMLGKVLKKEGVGQKVAFGTATLEGKVLMLRCDRLMPALAKNLKKFLKANRVMLNVQILDADGNIVEEDIEDLPDDPSLADDEPQTLAQDDTTQDDTVQDDPVQDDPVQDDDASAIIAGLQELKPAIAAAPEQVREKLAGAMKQVVALIKSGNVPGAREVYDRLVAAVDKLNGQAAATPSPEDGAPSPNEAIKALAERAKAAKAGIADAPANAAEALQKALGAAVAALKSQDIATASATLDKIEAALAKLAARQPKEDTATAASAFEALRAKAASGLAGDALDNVTARIDDWVARAQNGGDPDLGAATSFVDDTLKLQSDIDAVMPDFVKAMSAGAVADKNALSILFNTAVELVGTDNLARAKDNLAKAKQMIADGADSGANAYLDEIPDDVRPFAVSRLSWIDTRSKLDSEMKKLEAAIRSVCEKDPELKDVVDNVSNLFSYLEDLDDRLSDKLDDVVNAPIGNERENAKAAAKGILAEYEATLSEPFFQDVDQSNGFAKVAVASTARSALNDISKVLAA